MANTILAGRLVEEVEALAAHLLGVHLLMSYGEAVDYALATIRDLAAYAEIWDAEVQELALDAAADAAEARYDAMSVLR